MSKYEDMSNFEINMAVAKAQGLEVAEEQYESYGDRDENVVLIVRGVGFDGRSYCNNPADAYPIIFSNSIATFETLIGEPIWVATTNLDKSWLNYGDDGFDCYHKNPLRAAMIVYLMMQEASNDQP